MKQKPGVAGLPFLGVEAEVVNDQGQAAKAGEKGHLIIKKPWPGALLTCWNNPDRFEQYWNTIQSFFCTGDLAIKDEERYIQILGREDDVINVSGHRIGSVEMENVIVSYPSVAESAVIGVPDELTGEAVKAFVVLKNGYTNDALMVEKIKEHVREQVGKFSVPKEIEILEKLPKTRSGKIMRRLLKAQALGLEVGDASTLEE
jgi:acetyl-CoA synthetase